MSFNTSILTPKEKARYSRHTLMPEVGVEGQLKLKGAKVLVIGAGGLGSPSLLYLAAAGVGTIGIVDGDKVEDSNLQRQILFNINDIGKSKAQAAADHLKANNPHININVHKEFITTSNALSLISQYDIVADGTDNFATRYLINDACILANKPNVFASILKFQGQVSIFNYNTKISRGVNYRDVFPTPPPANSVPSCAEAGVLGVLPGIIGTLQATEVIKLITGIGKPLIGEILTFDALTMTSFTLKTSLNPDYQPVNELINYEVFCGTKNETIKEISVTKFRDILNTNEDIEIIDVREKLEYEIANFGGKLIPLKELEDRLGEISKSKKVVVHCKMGGRSKKAIEIMQGHGFENCWNLTGGIIAYSNEIDSSIPTY